MTELRLGTSRASPNTQFNISSCIWVSGAGAGVVEGCVGAGRAGEPRNLRHLHSTPYTLHPIPHTLHLTPYTLHPQPYTLHPTPYTLHPEPCTQYIINFDTVEQALEREWWKDALERAEQGSLETFATFTLPPTPYTLHPTPHTLDPDT